MPKLFDNLWVKIAALVLAFLLWFHVATDKVFQYSTTLNLTRIDLAHGLVLTEAPPDSINVVVSGPGKKLLKADWKKGGLRIVITRNIPGKFRSEINMDNTSLVRSDKVNLIEIISPREIVLDCDREMEKKVPVKSMVSIIPDEGFAVDTENTIVPDTVTITGPRSKIRAVEYIETAKESHQGLRNNLTMEIPLVYPDIYGLRIEPDTIDYVISVTPIRTRIFPQVAVKLINTPLEWEGSLSPNSVRVRASGKIGEIDALIPDSIFIEADYNLADSHGVVPLKVELPPSILFICTEPESVSITIIQ